MTYEWCLRAILTFPSSPSMCCTNRKIDSLRTKANWLISSGVILEIVSAGWMMRDREVYTPPHPRGVCLPLSEASVWICGPSGSNVQHPPSAIAAVLNCLSVRHGFLWPGDLPPTCPAHLPGLQLVVLKSGCVPVIVNETVDAKNRTDSDTASSPVTVTLLACLCVGWNSSFLTVWAVNTPMKHLT